MRFSLMPRKSVFFTQFQEHAKNTRKAAEALQDLLEDFTDIDRKVGNIQEIEHHGDNLTHEIVRELNATFVTPLDREDILGLASRLDDVADLANDVAELILIYKIDHVRPAAVRQAKILVSAATELVAMMDRLEKLKDLEQHWIKLHTFENEGDQIFREAIGELFGTERDAIELVKWKDLFERIEIAIDRCEDIANIVETIKIKHS